MLEINGTLIAIVINFVILVYVMNYFLYKPVLQVLSGRKAFVETTLAEAEAKLDMAKASVEEGRQVINNANVTSGRIMDEARKAAEMIKQEELDKTKLEISEQKKRAKADIEQYKIEARRAAVQDASKLSVMIAEKIIKKNMSVKVQRSMVNDLIGKLGD